MNIYEDSKYFNINSKNPWKDTPLEDFYSMTPVAKGVEGEEIISKILTSMGYVVEPRTNPGHDRIINGVKTEIKFSIATDRNTNWRCIFNHIGFEKDWDSILLVCVNGDGAIRGILFTREDFPMSILRHQQGGSSSKNDDYMIPGNTSKDALFNCGGTVIIE